MKFVVIIMLMVGLVSACASAKVPHPTHYTPQVRMEIHADSSFTSHERELIVVAVDTMRDQTGAFVDVNVVFDLNFDSMESLKRHANDNTLVRIGSDAKGLDKTTLGYCTTNYDDLEMSRSAKAALVYDRLSNDKVWIHVAMHEILHMVRLRHIDVNRTIMFAYTPASGNSIVTCMTSQDMDELCLTHGCNVAAMKPCNP